MSGIKVVMERPASTVVIVLDVVTDAAADMLDAIELRTIVIERAAGVLVELRDDVKALE